MTTLTGDNAFGVAKFIVDPIAGNGTHTTIAAAIADATIAQDIFIRPGIYSEDLTLKSGVNLVGFNGDDTTDLQVVINGKITYTVADTVSISGIRLTNTGTDFFLVVSGTQNCFVYLLDCYLITTSASTGISFTNSNGNSFITISNCQGSLENATGAIIASSSAGTVNFENCNFKNPSNSTTNDTFSAGVVNYRHCDIRHGITLSSSATATIDYTNVNTSVLNTTALTNNATSGTQTTNFGSFISGTATGVVCGAGATLTMADCVVNSSNASAISGAGAILYSPITFVQTSAITISTATPLVFGPSIAPIMANTNGTVYYDGTILNSISPGSAADVLTSNGVGLPPSFQAPTGGGGITEYFYAYLSSPASNVTGDNSFYDIIFDTATINTSSSYNSGTGIYTAPATGVYMFQIVITFVGGDVSTNSYLIYWDGSVYNSRAYQLIPTPQAGSTTTTLSATVFIPMTIGDGMKIGVQVLGANKNIEVFGQAPSGSQTALSTFSGFKVA